MSVKTYKAKEGETVFDMAITLYKDMRGTSDILLMNPALSNLDSVTYFGQVISWDDSIVYKKEVFVEQAKEAARSPWKTLQGQTVYDLAIQIYGDINNLGKIIAQVIDPTDPVTGKVFETEFTDNFLANSLFSRQLVATSQETDAGDFLLLESGDFMLLESGYKIALE